MRAQSVRLSPQIARMTPARIPVAKMNGILGSITVLELLAASINSFSRRKGLDQYGIHYVALIGFKSPLTNIQSLGFI